MKEIPYYEIEFGADGRLINEQQEASLAEAVSGGGKTLFVFAHGWNNSPGKARELFRRFFATVHDALPSRAESPVASVGVIWPSMRWPDEQDPTASSGGAASIHAAAADATEDNVFPVLRSVFPAGAEQEALGQLETLLTARPRDTAALRVFQEQLAVLAAGPDASAAVEDQGEKALLADDPEPLFDAYADLSPYVTEGGAAALSDPWNRMWNGAREAMRAASYYAMKKRAGIVGRDGLGPLLGRLPEIGNVRVHLIGHSFGARLVSFSLSGLPHGAVGRTSPVKSMFLVQGAFSHFTFARALPFHQEGGALAGEQQRVDGPIVVTHSTHDLALADLYPRASLISGQNTAARHNLLYRWGAMGWDGAQEVAAASAYVGPVGTAYALSPGRFLNLDCNRLIKDGHGPSGAHSDIIHPELGWMAVAAAGLGARDAAGPTPSQP
jgi:hypothetical protein